jgi:hypothetical protein
MAAITTPMVLTVFLVLVAGVVAWFKPRFWGFRIKRARRIVILRRLGMASSWGLGWKFSRFLREIERARKVGCSPEEVNKIFEELKKWGMFLFPELKEIHEQGGSEAFLRHIEYLKIP